MRVVFIHPSRHAQAGSVQMRQNQLAWQLGKLSYGKHEFEVRGTSSLEESYSIFKECNLVIVSKHFLAGRDSTLLDNKLRSRAYIDPVDATLTAMARQFRTILCSSVTQYIQANRIFKKKCPPLIYLPHTIDTTHFSLPFLGAPDWTSTFIPNFCSEVSQSLADFILAERSLLYFGELANLAVSSDADAFLRKYAVDTSTANRLDWSLLSRHPVHYCFRTSDSLTPVSSKPATKVLTALMSGAVPVVSADDYEARMVLGSDFPVLKKPDTNNLKNWLAVVKAIKQDELHFVLASRLQSHFRSYSRGLNLLLKVL